MVSASWPAGSWPSVELDPVRRLRVLAAGRIGPGRALAPVGRRLGISMVG